MNSSIKELIIDGSTVDRNPASAFRGLGAVTGNNSSRLLMDYKAKSPDSYWEIMELLFRPDYGAGLTHVKIELGADINSSSGTEPCVKGIWRNLRTLREARVLCLLLTLRKSILK